MQDLYHYPCYCFLLRWPYTLGPPTPWPRPWNAQPALRILSGPLKHLRLDRQLYDEDPEVIHLFEELDIRKAIDVHTKGPATGRHGSGHGATAQGTVGSLLDIFEDNEDFRALPHFYVLKPAMMQIRGYLPPGLLTHRPLSSFLWGLPYRILNINHKKELLRGLWVATLNFTTDTPHDGAPGPASVDDPSLHVVCGHELLVPREPNTP